MRLRFLACLVGVFGCSPLPQMMEPDSGVDPDTINPYPKLATKKAIDIAAGNGFVCAVVEGGTVRCWGWPGDVTTGGTAAFSHFGTAQYTSNRVHEPIEVPGITDATDIDTEYQTVCVRTAAKKAKCWGQNDEGQAGTGTDRGVMTPTELPLSNVVKVSVGLTHACALLEGGTVKCWGSNFSQQFRGITFAMQNDRLSPFDVPFITGATDLVAEYDGTCAKVAGGAFSCFGGFRLPDMRNTGTENIPYPLGVTGATSVIMGRQHSFAIVNGAAKAWGAPDSEGWLGDNSTFGDTNDGSPQQVRGLTSGVTDITFAGAVANGKGYMWANLLANGESGKSLIPVEVPVADVVQIVRGNGVACVRTRGGSVHCWGNNENGQLGTGFENFSTDSKYTPQKVKSFP